MDHSRAMRGAGGGFGGGISSGGGGGGGGLYGSNFQLPYNSAFPGAVHPVGHQSTASCTENGTLSICLSTHQDAARCSDSELAPLHAMQSLQYGVDLRGGELDSMGMPLFRPLTTYSWEQSDGLVKIYVPLRGVQTELLRLVYRQPVQAITAVERFTICAMTCWCPGACKSCMQAEPASLS